MRRVARTGSMRSLLAIAVAATLLGCRAEAPPAEPRPRLVLLIVADQFRADYLSRFGGLLDGGLGRLAATGVRFTGAYHDHPITDTGAGHATLATGLTPSRHGVISNYWYDPSEDDWVYAAGDSGEPSPQRLLGSTLGDWMKRADARSRVYAASGKDRVAVMLAGHDGDGAFWYSSSSGRFKTSDYYFEDDPPWLRRFNERQIPERWLGELWEPLPVAADELEGLGIEPFDQGPLTGTFPHTLGGAAPGSTRGFHGDLRYSPAADEHLGLLAEHLIVTHRLGSDRHPDLLALGFSALDYVGHRYGPDGRETLDTVLRLDRTLARLLEFVDETVGLERTVVAFTSDHGVAPVPEVRERLGLPGRRAGAEEIVCLQGVGAKLAARFGEGRWLVPGPSLDPEAIRRAGVERRVVERETERLIEQCPSVAEVWTRSELLAPAGGDDPWRRRAVLGFHADRSPDFLIRFDPYFTPTRWSAATHGSPYDYDARVPMILSARGLSPGSDERPVRTVDLAPTLAALVGVETPPELDGRDLGALLPRAAAATPVGSSR